MPTTYKRRIKLIQPKLQLKLVATFFGLTLLALLLQFLIFLRALTVLAEQLPEDQAVLLDAVPSLVLQTSLLALVVVLPLVLLVGVLATFRIAGPLYRLEMYLKQLLSGQDPGECRLRKGDELQNLCGLINRATEELRTRNAAPTRSDERKAA